MSTPCMSDIKKFLTDKLIEFVDRENVIPTKINLTKKEENALLSLTFCDAGEVATAILEKGAKAAIQARGNKLFGMTVHWDAPEFKIER